MEQTSSINGITSKILGWQNAKRTGSIVGGSIFSQYRETLGLDELRMIGIALLLSSIVLVGQIIYWIISIKRKKGKIFLKILLGLLANVLLLFLLVCLQLVYDNHLKQSYQPSAVEYERVASDLARIKWQTKEPSISSLVWGTDKDHLQEFELGKNGDDEVVDHEVLVNAKPGERVYFVIVHRGEKYGDSNREPFVIDLEPKYSLKEIESLESGAIAGDEDEVDDESEKLASESAVFED